MYITKKIQKAIGQFRELELLYENRLIFGQILLELKRNGIWKSQKFTPDTWDDFGFKVYSQSNDDGLIQFLISNIEIKNKTFIEFGTENYKEANTRFLLLNNNWTGFIMDGSKRNMDQVRSSYIYWKYTITASDVFITKENINKLILSSNFDEDVGILSIDVDGVDYWIWQEISCISPRIVICEYNSIFGKDFQITVPYRSDFYRTSAHYSNLYYGASLKALTELGKKKGYKLVCTNQLGNNAFFVRNDIYTSLEEVSVESAYRQAKFRESKYENGKLSYLSFIEGLKLIGEKEIVDLCDGKMKAINTLLGGAGI